MRSAEELLSMKKHCVNGTPEQFAYPICVIHGANAACRVPRQQHMRGAIQVMLLE
jgi:hypothetical protein